MVSAPGVSRCAHEKLGRRRCADREWWCDDVGRVRTNNEDSFRIVEPMNLFILSDGMGGEAHGEVASAMAVETVEKYCNNPEASKEDTDVTLHGTPPSNWARRRKYCRTPCSGPI